MTTSSKINDSLYLVRQIISKEAPKKVVELPTNHIAIIDCSGSMWSDLPKIREQLKRKLPKMLKESDTISLIWFSGRSQFGTLLEGEPVATLSDLKEVERAIDRWLQPQGLTGFKEPLEEVSKLVEKIAKKTPKDAVYSLFFMSDGQDNCYSKTDILKAVEKAANAVTSATFVEYGYYADRPLLTAMAEKAGGSLIFAETFDKYAPTFESAISKKVSGAPKVEAKIEGDAIGGFAYAIVGDELLTFTIESGQVKVPQDLTEVWYLSPTKIGASSDSHNASATYAAVSLFSQRMKSDVVWALLKFTGDVAFIDKYSACFGKQKYSAFVEEAQKAVFDKTLQLSQGQDFNKVPKDDAFTVLDLLRILSEDDGNRVLLDHPTFKYNRIGRSRIDASDQLTEEETQELQDLTTKLAKTKKASELKAIQARISEIQASKPEALKFEADPAPDGYPISSLTFNEERPNVSFLVRKEGSVDLSSRLPEEFKGDTLGKVPSKLKTFVYRNYAVVKDGLVNIDQLPCRLTQATFEKLAKAGILTVPYSPSAIVGFNLGGLPIINRKMVQAVSAKTLFEKEFQVTRYRAEQKVYNTIKKDRFPRKSEGYAALYGDTAATWLKDQGVTDYSGFGPKTVQAEATDVYMAKELAVSLKGYSTIPSLKDFEKQAAKGKLNGPATLMKTASDAVSEFLKSDVYTKITNQDALFETWLEGQAKATTAKVRGLLFELAQTKFSIIVGQVWPTEFSSLDENTLTVDIDGTSVVGTLNMKEVEVKI